MCLHIVKGFHILLFKTNDPIGTQLNVFQHCYLIQIIHLNLTVMCLPTIKLFQVDKMIEDFYLAH